MTKIKEFMFTNKLFAAGVVVLLLGLSGAFTLHTVDQKVNSGQEVEINLPSDVVNEYFIQIIDFVSYPNKDKLTLLKTYKKKGKEHLVIFDGYSNSVFVFDNGMLVQYGSDARGDLINVKDK